MSIEEVKNMEDANKWYSEEYEKIKNMDASEEYKEILLHQLNGTFGNIKKWFETH